MTVMTSGLMGPSDTIQWGTPRTPKYGVIE